MYVRCGRAIGLHYSEDTRIAATNATLVNSGPNIADFDTPTQHSPSISVNRKHYLMLSGNNSLLVDLSIESPLRRTISGSKFPSY